MQKENASSRGGLKSKIVKVPKVLNQFLEPQRLLICLLATITFLTQYSSFYGEDIVNARNDYLYGARTDFWGGISTLIYAHVPSVGVRWQIWVAVFQISMTGIGLQKLLALKTSTFGQKIIGALGIYTALLFCSQMTRDGLMFSFLIFGLALFKKSVSENLDRRTLILSFLTITLGMCFRPWLSIALAPIILLILRHSPVKLSKLCSVFLIIAISIAPALTDFAIGRSLSLVKSYPEQQVMLMDSAASYCYTNNIATGLRAEKSLELFVTDSSYPTKVCQLYRPDTWVSLTKADNVSARGILTDFSLIQVGDSVKYEELKALWVKMIISDPVTYFQNKILFAGKVLIGSDSRNITFLNVSSKLERALSFYRILFDIAILLHLYSLLAIIILLIAIPSRRYFKREKSGIDFDDISSSLLSAMTIWLICSSIAYIGSNGRYTYTITIISMILFITYRQEHQDFGLENE